MPASAVSTGNVTCFSTSVGDSAGASVLICTWLFVISGTASIGSLVSDQIPTAAASKVTSSTNHLRCTENAITRSIIGGNPQTFVLSGVVQWAWP